MQPSIQDIWAQVSKLSLKLQSHIQWHHHIYRGKVWYLLQDCATNQHYYITEAGYAFLTRLSGEHPIESLLEELSAKNPDLALTPEEAVQLLLRLQTADLLVTQNANNIEQLFATWQKKNKAAKSKILLSPLSWRFRLFDPTKFLIKCHPFVRSFFCWPVFLIWAIIVVVALFYGGMYANELGDYGKSRLLSPTNILLLWILYPIIKALHELGHAFALRLYGKPVNEMGIMFLVFMPMPYVEASVATGLSQKYKRILISAMGIMVELFISAIALWIWLNVQPGIIKDIAFNVMIIGGVSTLLFNGNPLLKFDGYFVFSDLIEIPNLAQRSKDYYIYLCKRYLLGLMNTPNPVVSKGERSWFIIYGAASYCYRLMISLTIALYLATSFFFIGVVLAIWSLSLQLIWPVAKMLLFLINSPSLENHRRRSTIAASCLLCAMIAFILIPKWPHFTIAQGIVLLPETAMLRTQSSGEVVKISRIDGEQVKTGDQIITLYDPELTMKKAILVAQKQELQLRLDKQQYHDRTEAAIQKERLKNIFIELEEVDQELDHQVLKSPAEGTLELIKAADLPGRFIEKGTLIGAIQQRGSAYIRVVIPQTVIKMIQTDLNSIAVRSFHKPDDVFPAKLITQTPSATQYLPSAALAKPNGGAIAIDASAEDKLKTLEPIFVLDVSLDNQTQIIPGTRVLVRFEHSPSAIWYRLYFAFKQLLLNKLNN